MGVVCLQGSILRDSGKKGNRTDMKTVTVRNLVIGEGIPKICVPLMGDATGVLAAADKVKKTHADLVEWRIDTDPEAECVEKTLKTARELRDILGEMPLLFTIRTKEEGGNMAVSPKLYCEMNEALIASGYIDLVDIEYFQGKSVRDGLLRSAKVKGVQTVLSSHDFEKTPDGKEMIQRLCSMQQAGADLIKLAVMPRCDEDVVELLKVTWEMKIRHPDTPVISISMGKKGALSRLGGELFGSCVTFGAYDKASAPGQISVEELYEILGKLHG